MTDATMDKSSRPEAIIEIRLGKLQQLFNSLDPSPFHDRDLDHDAEEYIVGWAEEIALPLPLKQSRRRLRLIFYDGRIALAVGIAFLFVCILIRQVAHSFGSGTASEIIAEGMLIAGWVAMWRPLDTFLYDWWPIRRRGRVLGKLAEMPVLVRAA